MLSTIFLLTTNVLMAQTITTDAFTPQYDLNAGVGVTPNNVVTGDFDGDGKLDLVSANGGVIGVSVFRNTGLLSGGGAFDGTSFTQSDFTLAGGATKVKVGDLDGDGKPDLVVTNSVFLNVAVLRNTSTGVGNINFASPVAYAVASPFGLAIGDIDGDGKSDLIVPASGENSVFVLRNTGLLPDGVFDATSFKTSVSFTTGTSPRSVALADLDGDGRLDVVAASSNSSATLSVLRNTSASGSISFAPSVDFVAAATPWDIVIGDLDGDGKPDLVAANNSATAKVAVLRNTCTSGTISFEDRVEYTTVVNRSVAIADINGDGKLDVIAGAYSGTGILSILINQGLPSGSFVAESFAAPVNINTGSHFLSIEAADIDGDGKPDLLGTHTPGNNAFIPMLRNILSWPPKVLVAGITVKGAGGLTTIEKRNGTLLMEAEVLPVDATLAGVIWSVADGTGKATINSLGLLTAVADGTVTVTAKAKDGSGITASLVITIDQPVGLSSKLAQTVNVYPNPVVNELNVSFTTPKATVALYNSLGRKVQEVFVNGSQVKVDVSSYASGVYFVKVNNDKVVKFVK